MVSATTRVGPYELGERLPSFGDGWYAARRAGDADFGDGDDDDDLPARAIMRVALPGEGPSLALEGAARVRLRSPAVPTLLRRGVAAGRSWLAFRPITAVKIDVVLGEDPLPVPFALACAASLAGALAALEGARVEPRQELAHGGQAPSAPSFDELLLDDAGALVVLTPPPGSRMVLPGLLRVPRRDRFLHPPEGARGHVAGDVYAVGSVLHQLLTAQEPFASTSLDEIEAGRVIPARDQVNDLPGRVDDVVRRAMARDPSERFESLEELILACARAADDFPPLEDDERKALVRARAGWRIDEAARFFT